MYENDRESESLEDQMKGSWTDDLEYEVEAMRAFYTELRAAAVRLGAALSKYENKECPWSEVKRLHDELSDVLYPDDMVVTFAEAQS